MRKLLFIACLSLYLGALACVVLVPRWLAKELPEGVALGTLVSTVGFCAGAGLPLIFNPGVVDRVGAFFRALGWIALSNALMWYPVSTLLAGNLKFVLYKRGYCLWQGYSLITLALILTAQIGFLFVVLKRHYAKESPVREGS